MTLSPSLRILCATLLALAGVWPSALQAGQTIARFSTSFGDFDVLLYDEDTPLTVRNFVAYAQSERYDPTFIHRSTSYNPADLQIIQGGSYVISGTTIFQIPTDPPIPLEAGLPNVRGTIAMARQSAPDTATAGWFFNVTDNPGLDPAPGVAGYAVFGRVVGHGMTIVDAMAAVTVYNASEALGEAFSELPLLNPFLGLTNFLSVFSISTEPFRVTNLSRVGGGFQLDWPAFSTNTPVNVERTTNLATGPWTVVSSNNTNSTFIDTAPPPAGAFYRVVIP